MSKGFLYDEGDELITRKEDAGGLPDTTEASAGDVLSLDEDKSPVWSAPSGGGGGVLIVEVDEAGQTVTTTDPDNHNYEGTPTNATYEDISTAFSSGIIPILKTDTGYQYLSSFAPDFGISEEYTYGCTFGVGDYSVLLSASSESGILYLFNSLS